MKADKQKSQEIRHLTSPLTLKSATNEQRKSTDYVVDSCAILALFNVGTGGLDIGLITSYLGLAGRRRWDRTSTRYSLDTCNDILKV